MSNYMSNGWMSSPSQSGFASSSQFMGNSLSYSPQKCCKTCSSPCCSSNCSNCYGGNMQSPPMMQNRNFPHMNRPPQGIRLRCPSCCRPAGSCCCGCCNCASRSKTFY